MAREQQRKRRRVRQWKYAGLQELYEVAEAKWERHELSAYGSKQCPHCFAKLFQEESCSLCCGDGKIRPPPLSSLPPQIAKLYNPGEHATMGERSMHRSFMKYGMAYNSMYAFASVGVKLQRFEGRGPRQITFNGRVHHLIGSAFARQPGNYRPGRRSPRT